MDVEQYADLFKGGLHLRVCVVAIYVSVVGGTKKTRPVV